MGWVSLSLRKLSLREDINSGELRDCQISRSIRSNQRNLSYDESVLNSSKTKELTTAKSAYLEIREERPDIDSDDYSEWYQEYTEAKEDYEAQKVDINEYYDDLLNELEEESTDTETAYQDEQTSLEANLESWNSELEAVGEQISSDIDSTALSLS